MIRNQKISVILKISEEILECRKKSFLSCQKTEGFFDQQKTYNCFLGEKPWEK